jgi:dephospho-CoA kinase
MKKLKIAVTGGIGGGKSSFCKFIAEKGYPVFSADEISKEILKKHPAVKKAIIKVFGKESYINGEVNKKYLAEKVFSNPSAVKKINSIVHPAVISELDELMKESLKKNDLVFVEAALIYEAKMEEMFDYVLVITTDELIRKLRAAKKGIDESEFYRRSENQIPDEKKRKKADFVFENNTSESDLRKKAEMFLSLIIR